MAVDFDILELMPYTTIGLRAPSGTSRSGESQYSGAVTNYRGRVEGSSKIFRSPTGQDIVSVRSVMLDRVVSGVTTKYEITLPDGTKPPIMEVETVLDDSGEYFTVIYTGNAQSQAQRSVA